MLRKMSGERHQWTLSLGSICLVLACVISAVALAEAPAAPNGRDVYGGWSELRLESTGFFRLDMRDGICWMVTPEGNAFVSKGVNHVSFRADNAPKLGYSPYQRAVQNKLNSWYLL